MTAQTGSPAPPATAGDAGATRLARSRRNSELWLLLLAMVLVALYGATVEANQFGTITADFWVPAAVLPGLPRPARGRPVPGALRRPGAHPRGGTAQRHRRRFPAPAGPGPGRRRRPGEPGDLRRHRRPAARLDPDRGGARRGAALHRPRPPLDLEVRLHPRPGRHRAGDAPRGAAEEHLRGQRRRALDPDRLLLHPAGRVRQAGAAGLLRLLPGPQARGALAGQPPGARHRLPARTRPRPGRWWSGRSASCCWSSRRTSAPRCSTSACSW